MSTRARKPISRRALLRQSAIGFGALGMYGAFAQENPLAVREPHFTPRAKNVIFLFMHGGPSHVDTFDPKPRLDRDHGKPLPFKAELQFADRNVGGLLKQRHRTGDGSLAAGAVQTAG